MGTRLGAAAALRRTQRFASLVVLGTLVALAYHALLGALGFHPPWTGFLFNADDRFSDWDDSAAQALSGHPYFHHRTPALAAYFPAAYLIIRGVARVSDVGNLLLYMGIGVALLAASIRILVRGAACPGDDPRVRRRMALLLVLTALSSYPVIFALDRGNIDLWIAGLCTLYVGTLGSRLAPAGGLALALAISMKAYPAVFLVLGLMRRDYRGVAWSASAALALSVIALLTLDGGAAHNLEGLWGNLTLFHERYVLGDASLFASSDPYNAIRLISSGMLWHAPPTADAGTLQALSQRILAVYRPACASFAAAGVLFALFVRVPPWRRTSAVCLVAILFPNVASDYKLCCLIPGLVSMLIGAEHTRRESLAFWTFYLLMIPKSYLYLQGRPLSMLVNPLLLIFLAAVVMADRDAWRGAVSEWRSRLGVRRPQAQRRSMR